MSALVLSLCPIRRKIVPDTGPSHGDGLTQYLHHDSIELHHRLLSELIRRLIRVNPGTEENFIRINIPDARNHLLVHKQGFEPASRGDEQPQKLFKANREGIVPEPAGRIPIQPFLVEQRQAAKPPGIPVSDFGFSTAVEMESKMDMLHVLGRRRPEEQ
jgi:hypothetical protein